MALTKETTSAIVGKFGANANDTGNTKVQIALLSERIKELTAHCAKSSVSPSATNSGTMSFPRHR